MITRLKNTVSLASFIEKEIGLRATYMLNGAATWRPRVVTLVPSRIVAAHIGHVMSYLCRANIARATMFDNSTKIVWLLAKKRR